MYDVAMSCCTHKSCVVMALCKIVIIFQSNVLKCSSFNHENILRILSWKNLVPNLEHSRFFNPFDPEVKCSLISLIEIVHNSLLKRLIKKANELWFQKSVESCMTFHLLSNRDFSRFFLINLIENSLIWFSYFFFGNLE